MYGAMIKFVMWLLIIKKKKKKELDKNIVSQEVIDKLQLQVETHHITWENNTKSW